MAKKITTKLPSYRINLFVKTSFIAWHRWKDAPEHRKYLRHFHRHTFHVTAHYLVSQANRELEFHDLRDDLDGAIVDMFKGKRTEFSCEDIAIRLLDELGDKCSAVTVDEDGECGSTVARNSPKK